MSLLPNQTNVNLGEYFFIKATGQTLTVSSLNTNYISANTLAASTVSTANLLANSGNISTLSTAVIDIDGQVLTAAPGELLLNGVPLATLSSLSSIGDWSLEPAISTVQMGGNNIYQAGNISTNSIIGGSAFFGNLMAINSMFISTYTSTTSSLIEVADLGNFSTLSTGNLFGGNVIPSTLWGQPSSFYIDGISTISTLNSDTITCSTLIASTKVSTPELFVSSINGAEITQSSINISSLVTTSVSSVFGNVQFSLISTLQMQPSFSLGGVNLGLGSLFGNIAGAALGGLGVVVGGAALGTGIAALVSSRQTKTLTASTFELVNTTTQLQVSTLGSPFSTIYRFVSSTAADVPGEEIFVSTLSPAGLAIRSFSDPLNTVSTPNSTIQYFGQWVPLDISGVIPVASTVSTFSDLYTSSLLASTVGFTNDTLLKTGSTFGGSGFVSTLEVALAGSSPPLDAHMRVGALVISGTDVGGINVTKDVLIANQDNGNRLDVFGAGGIGPSTIAFLSDIPAPLSTFSTFAVSSLSTSFFSSEKGLIGSGNLDISGGGALTFSADPILTVVQGGQIATPLLITGEVDTEIIFGQTATAYITGYSSISGVNIITSTVQMPAGGSLAIGTGGGSEALLDRNKLFLFGADSVLSGASTFTDKIQSFSGNIITMPGQNLYLNGPGRIYSGEGYISSLNTSSITIAGPSTITLAATGTAGTNGQPLGRLVMSGTDLDLGQNDLWAQQLRVGAGNPSGSAQTEVIWYSPDGLTQRGLGLGGSDLTIRVQSTINSGTNNGYLLDTLLNRPIFSTINAGTSTALVAQFPSTTLGNFGYSTVSVIPPLTYIASVYDSTTQTVTAANTSTPVLWNTTPINLGGFTIGVSTIGVPVAGVYEHSASIQFATTSGGTNEAEFWLTKNGAAVAQTNSRIAVVNNGDTIGTVSIFDTAAAGDKYGWMIYSSDTNMAATSVAAGATPAIPSIIFNTKRIG